MQQDQREQDERDLGAELDQTGTGRPEDEDLARKRHASDEPRMLGENVGPGVEGLQHEIPDEVSAQEERPVVRHLYPHDMAEDDDENGDGEQGIDQRPDESEERTLVLDLEIPDHEASEQLAVSPHLNQSR